MEINSALYLTKRAIFLLDSAIFFVYQMDSDYPFIFQVGNKLISNNLGYDQGLSLFDKIRDVKRGTAY